MIKSFIKWTGSKRLQSSWIVDKFPDNISTYYEPFLGSGSVMLEMLSRKDINVERVVASDICEPLIGLWNMVKNEPQKLISSYRDFHKDFVKDRKNVFNLIRKEFNEDKTKYENFLFLTRTCINGLIRFNSKGDFNSTCHLTRNGIVPESLEKIIWNVHNLVQKVDFINQSYECIIPNKNDLIYFDPPYMLTTKNMYYGGIDYLLFSNYVNNISCKWLLSLDGLIENVDVVDDININYKNVYYANESYSTFKKVQDSTKRIIREALYTNYDLNRIEIFF